jgi:hypothetical protein
MTGNAQQQIQLLARRQFGETRLAGISTTGVGTETKIVGRARLHIRDKGVQAIRQKTPVCARCSRDTLSTNARSKTWAKGK